MKRELNIIALSMVLRLLLEPLTGLLLPIFLRTSETMQIMNNELFWFLYPYIFNIIFGLYPLLFFGKWIANNFSVITLISMILISVLNLPFGLIFILCLLVLSRS